MVKKTEACAGQQVKACAPTEQHSTSITLKESDGSLTASLFRQDGYVVVREVFDQPSVKIYATYALMMKENGFIQPWEEQHGFNARYGDPLMESLLLHLQPVMEQTTGLSLLPTYSFLRVYETGAELTRHTDRPSCEISASLAIGYDAPHLWPLWVKSNQQSRPLALEAGDMLIYRGQDIPHWRETFDGRYWIQAFFHYVDAAGPLASYKYDGRTGIGQGDAPGANGQSRPQ
ncbi:MAG: hypothetical protein H7Y30_10880 [Pyrinomonadaceae bacterium]|nr:hypothetical protein [Pyrinomonadaceae bacterium]